MSESVCEHCGTPIGAESQASVCPRCALALALDEPEIATAPGGTPGGEPSAEPPRRIGRFDLVRRLGEGGMGEVWLAEQREPVQRRVALKIIKLGMDSRALVARFESERQALAMMDHPAVAKVFDAGTTPGGRPYFVMEYVPGESITDYCDRCRLDSRARLELFRQVCDGVTHAHQKGIIHRDLKPSNILVVEQDGRPVPKIIDFGIAKALDQKLVEQSVFTELGVLVGTPEYMSPEQAAAEGAPVDTRTDVYSLGVVLYELMAGALPFDPQELRSHGYEGIRRVIREVEPSRPSTRVNSLGARATGLAERRRTDPISLERQLRGDLDWITMKALDKEPSRRYDSCAELSADVGRFLTDEPVLAGPPSAVYRAHKFVRRHRVWVAFSAAIVVLLVAGLAATTSFWAIARSERAEVLRLADLKLIRDYTEDAAELWPPHPDNVPAIETWLRDKGEPLVARLPLHRETLATLRARALPYDEDQRAHDRETHPDARELRETREALAETKQRIADVRANYHEADRDEILEHYEFRRREYEETIARLEPEVVRRRTWRFDDPALRWEHEMLTELVERLAVFADPDPFAGVMGSVRTRLELARSIEERSVTGPEVAAAWREAVTAIAASPRYAKGLEIGPQIGLVPLGADPDSGLWEFWHVASGERPREDPDPDAVDRWRIRPETGMVFVLLPGGSFRMGAQRDDPTAPNYDPQAQRREWRTMVIELAPFLLSKYEMTQAQWRRLAGSNPSRFSVIGEWGDDTVTDTNPVEMVTWVAADELARRHALALPTEAQWEYAARAGTSTPWWTGADPLTLDGAANLQDAALMKAGGPRTWSYEEWLDDGYDAHAPVGTYRANPFGLHEMIGNVEEWCRDYYRSPYRAQVAPADGYRHVPLGTSSRIARGGSYRSLAHQARSATRSNVPDGTAESTVGVRMTRELR